VKAKEIFDGGFLECVRYGIRRADDPLVLASVRVMDKVLKVETPRGACFLRYNGDGYGQRDDGNPYHDHWGVGRPWPLLGGERGHYEIALGRENGGNVDPWIWSLEGFASRAGLLPEQVVGRRGFARKTSRTRSLDGRRAASGVGARGIYQVAAFQARRKGVDRVDEAAARYVDKVVEPRRDLTIWGRKFPSKTVLSNTHLRVVDERPFMARATWDNWKTRAISPRPKPNSAFRFAIYPRPAQTANWCGRCFSARWRMGRRELRNQRSIKSEAGESILFPGLWAAIAVTDGV
jgi:glucoamylase